MPVGAYRVIKPHPINMIKGGHKEIAYKQSGLYDEDRHGDQNKESTRLRIIIPWLVREIYIELNLLLTTTLNDDIIEK